MHLKELTINIGKLMGYSDFYRSFNVYNYGTVVSLAALHPSIL